jgi:hypothetical protein
MGVRNRSLEVDNNCCNYVGSASASPGSCLGCGVPSLPRRDCEQADVVSWGMVAFGDLGLGKVEACHHGLGSKNSYIGY